MSIILGQVLGVGQGVSNTGKPPSEFIPKNIDGVILLPKGTAFTQTQQLTLDTVLQDMAKEDDPLQRAYPVLGFESIEDQSSEDKIFETQYGNKRKSSKGSPAYRFGLYEGMHSWQNHVDFDNQQGQWEFMFIDGETNAFWGKKVGNTLAGMSLDMLSVSLPKLQEGDTPFSHMWEFALKSYKELKNFTVAQFDDDNYDVTTMVEGLQTITLTNTTSMTSAGVVTIRAVAMGTNMYTAYSSNLDDTTAWVATDDAGTALTTSSTATNAASKAWDVTVDVSGLATGDRVYIKNPAPSVLGASAGINVPGFESDTIIVTKG